MPHSKVTSNHIPGKIRKELRIKAGDQLEYTVEGDYAAIRVHPGTRSLKGVPASKKRQSNVLRASPQGCRENHPRVRGCGVSRRRLIETNLIVRHLVQDHAGHAKAAGKLFEACDRGDLVVVVLSEVLAECVFVLKSFYGHSRGKIASALRALISSPGVEINAAAIHLDALSRYGRSKAPFVDCVIAAASAARDTPIASFDQDFRKFPDVRIENQ